MSGWSLVDVTVKSTNRSYASNKLRKTHLYPARQLVKMQSFR